MANELISLDSINKIVNKASNWEELVGLGMQIREWKDKSQWLLGVLANRVEKNYGENKLGEYAANIGVNKNSLRVYRWVVKKVEEHKIDTNNQLPFSAYQIVAGTENPSQWIQKAADNCWSFEKLATKIRQSKQKVLNSNELTKGNICPRCGYKWDTLEKVKQL